MSKRWTLRLRFKPQDCWIGCFWRTTKLYYTARFEVWVCLLPMLPIHFCRIYNLPSVRRQSEATP